MKRFRVMLKANIEKPLIDSFNITANDIREAMNKAKDFFFIRLSTQGVEILENDIEVIRVTNDCGQVLNCFKF